MTDLCCTLAGGLFLALLLREMLIELVRAGRAGALRTPQSDCPPPLSETDLLRRLGYYGSERRVLRGHSWRRQRDRRPGRTAGRA